MPGLTQNMVAEAAALMPKLMWAGQMDDDGKKDPFFEKIPLGHSDAWVIRWDQMGAPYGLLPQSTLDSAPVLMEIPGVRVFETEPGVYRGYTQIRESLLTKGREYGTLADPLIAGTELTRVMLYFKDFLLNRFRKAYADLAINGQINNTNIEGVQHSYQIQSFQKFNVSAWLSNPAGATPIDDLRAIQTTANRGTSSRFGQKSCIVMVDEGINALLATAQIRNSFRSEYGASYMAPFDNNNLSGAQPPLNGDRSMNKLFFGMGLAEIVPWNHGYYANFNDALNYNKANFVKFLPNTSAAWLGYRPDNQQIGELTTARHAGLEAVGDKEDFDVVKVKDESAGAEWMDGVYIKVHYRNRQPTGYDFEIGVNFTPQIWYDDCMLSVTWS